MKRSSAVRAVLDKAAYRQRNEVEQLIECLNQCRCIATPYKKRAANYLAMFTLGMPHARAPITAGTRFREGVLTGANARLSELA